MRFRMMIIVALGACFASNVGMGQLAGSDTDVSGKWIISADLYGTIIYWQMELKQDGNKLTGTYTGDKLTSGTVSGGTVHLLATSESGITSDVSATVHSGVITGSTTETDPNDKDHPALPFCRK
jgi:amidase